ncbi:Dephospho-CoA kinase [Pseudobythopirellula maris]|uniref:Dephospho-CoA kinase n=1 Tax=Pseudobythopirellula maris TaxID=2527991 RepID=A0A5C5ZQ71_9BACT|nr:dephospho-CoA kinase [Pseudobythopirellula maris]TWT89629.1 Dephospho-CoA kinase [Pseudobythopirellula maris]
MLTIGLTGGVASGKSTAARLIAEQAAGQGASSGEAARLVLNADEIAHRVLDEPEVVAALIERWGDGVRRRDGTLDRRAIGDRVFGDRPTAEADRRALEALIHPRVRKRLMELREGLASQGAPAVVLDIPLLLEKGWDDDCDLVVFIEVPQDERRRRAAERGWGPDELDRRESAQLSLEEKRSRSDAVIAGGDSIEALSAAVRHWWNSEAEPRTRHAK